MKILAIIASCFILSLPANGQSDALTAIQAKDVNINLSSDNTLKVSMNIIIPAETKISSNRMITLTPVLHSETGSTVLPSVYLYGRKREIISERNNRLPIDAYQILRCSKNTEQNIDYHTTLPYQEWMQNATLVLEQDLCGCGNNQEENMEQKLAQVTCKPKPILPAIAYIVPETESFKRRTKAGSAFLDFPVNQTVIYPDYRKNPVELAKIIQTIESVPKADILQIEIHGFASPEGSFSNNAHLAKGRSEALKQYIVKKYNLSDTLFTVQSTPEDWEGFKTCVLSSDIEQKDTILAIINSNSQADEKEAQLKQLHVPYTYILKEWFPALRHSDYKIEYRVAPFTAEETRKIIKTQPELLSLKEMYDAAQLCEKKSDEYKTIMTTAINMFPDNPAVYLNAAAMELENGNIAAARKYMEKANMNTQEAKDNMQRITLLEGGNK